MTNDKRPHSYGAYQKPATEPQQSEKGDNLELEAIKYPITPAVAGEEGARRVVVAVKTKMTEAAIQVRSETAAMAWELPLSNHQFTAGTLSFACCAAGAVRTKMSHIFPQRRDTQLWPQSISACAFQRWSKASLSVYRVRYRRLYATQHRCREQTF